MNIFLCLMKIRLQKARKGSFFDQILLIQISFHLLLLGSMKSNLPL